MLGCELNISVSVLYKEAARTSQEHKNWRGIDDILCAYTRDAGAFENVEAEVL